MRWRQVKVEVVAIVSASRERATTMRKEQTGVDRAAIAFMSLARVRMMSVARARTSAWARATASQFPIFYAGSIRVGLWVKIWLLMQHNTLKNYKIFVEFKMSN